MDPVYAELSLEDMAQHDADYSEWAESCGAAEDDPEYAAWLDRVAAEMHRGRLAEAE